MIRLSTKCRRCGQAFGNHSGASCPGGVGVFERIRAVRGASQSFTEAEVNALERICRGLPAREDLRGLARSPVFQSLARKVQAMSRTAAANREAHEQAQEGTE